MRNKNFFKKFLGTFLTSTIAISSVGPAFSSAKILKQQKTAASPDSKEYESGDSFDKIFKNLEEISQHATTSHFDNKSRPQEDNFDEDIDTFLKNNFELHKRVELWTRKIGKGKYEYSQKEEPGYTRRIYTIVKYNDAKTGKEKYAALITDEDEKSMITMYPCDENRYPLRNLNKKHSYQLPERNLGCDQNKKDFEQTKHKFLDSVHADSWHHPYIKVGTVNIFQDKANHAFNKKVRTYSGKPHNRFDRKNRYVRRYDDRDDERRHNRSRSRDRYDERRHDRSRSRDRYDERRHDGSRSRDRYDERRHDRSRSRDRYDERRHDRSRSRDRYDDRRHDRSRSRDRYDDRMPPRSSSRSTRNNKRSNDNNNNENTSSKSPSSYLDFLDTL